MRKVIGIGETILDIIFRGDQPSAAVPGGSVFNGIVSLGRMGANVGFISETGNDRVGNIILQFMRDNNIPTDHVNVFPDGKSPVSLAFLNEQSDAEYIFYKDYPAQRLEVHLFPLRAASPSISPSRSSRFRWEARMPSHPAWSWRPCSSLLAQG